MNDRDTGFDRFHPRDLKGRRPYVVIGPEIGGRVRVVPQSTKDKRGVFVPDGAVEGLEAGHFIPWSTTVRVALAARCQLVGWLPREYLGEIKEQWQASQRPETP